MHSRVLVDTSAIYALISRTDNFHHRALRIYENLLDRGDEFYTTSYILMEVSALVQRRHGFQPLKAFMESISDIFKIYWIDQVIHKEAWKLMMDKNGSGLSLVDCATIIVAKRLDAMVFAFDEDLAKEAVIVIH